MKNYSFVSLIAILVSASVAQAAGHSSKNNKSGANTAAASERSVVSSQSAPARTSGSNVKLGVGFTTLASGGFPLSGLGGAPSLFVELNETHTIQAFLAIGSTSPFNFGVGGAYRATVMGNQSSGFHVGGGLDLGTTGATEAFYINIRPMAGFHFGWPNNDHIVLSVDGGPVFNITNGAFNFGMGPLSSLLGLSAHYMF